jgi:hypothetical protein
MHKNAMLILAYFLKMKLFSKNRIIFLKIELVNFSKNRLTSSLKGIIFLKIENKIFLIKISIFRLSAAA